MNVRKKIWPKTFSDGLSMGFLLIIVPLIYWFELWVVLPDLFHPGSPHYIFHFIFGNFIMMNVVGNFTYTILCDTSTRPLIMSISKAKTNDGWRFCASCEAVSPPRSWHCQTCDACILKRDHHCIFTGCCIGHFNHRYFLMFIFYLFIGTSYSFYYNNHFIWNRIKFEFPMSIVKIVFPLAIFVFGYDDSLEQVYLMLYIVSVIGMGFTGALCLYHFHLVATGSVAHERTSNNSLYNYGVMQNVRQVLGEKWYLAWTMPYVESKMINDGLSWCSGADWQENAKNR